MTFRISFLPAFLIFNTPFNSFGQSVDQLGITKRRIYSQSSISEITLTGVRLNTFIEGDGVDAFFPASEITLQTPNGTETLELDEDRWRSESATLSPAAFNATYPDGNYFLLIGDDDNVQITFDGGAFPAPPLFSATAGKWQNGKYVVSESEAAEGFEISTSGNSNGFLSAEIYSEEDDIFFEVDPSGLALEVEIAPGALQPGTGYFVDLESDEVIFGFSSFEFPWTNDNTESFGILSSSNQFILEVVPDPLDVTVQLTGPKSGVLLVTSETGFTYSLIRSVDLSGETVVSSQSGNGTTLSFPFDDSQILGPRAFFWIKRIAD